jgi:hypothetical protein
MCTAKPREKCVLSTGKPSLKTHHDRTLAAMKVCGPENIGQAGMRIVKEATRGFRIFFH